MTTIYEEQSERLDEDMEPKEIYSSEPICPECGAIISIQQGHCMTCAECGWSLCGI